MKKQLAKAYILALILLFYMPTILFYGFEDHWESTNYEQRAAAEKPVFSFQTITQYPQEFEQYYNDHLPFRSQLIEYNVLTDYYLFRQSPVSKVILGKDGWLFYNPCGSDGDPIADYRGDNLFTQEKLEDIAGNLTAIQDSLHRQGKQFVLMFAPSKESVYGNSYLPDAYVNGNTYTKTDQLAEYLQAHTDIHLVYPKAQLLEAIEQDPERDYYFKTDTHWNQLGGYIGASALLNTLDIPMPDLDTLQITARHDHVGDLATMMGLAKYLKYDTFYNLTGYCDLASISESFPVEGDTTILQYRAENADSRNFFVIRDSFGEGLFPYLSFPFSCTTFVHRDTYTPDMLSEYPSDIVVLQLSDRYTQNLDWFTII